MPSRWWVPIPGLRPEYVRLHHLHAAVSGWFDQTPAEHSAVQKPYAVSPLTHADDGVTGLEIAALTRAAECRLDRATRPGRPVRLGNQNRTIGVKRLIHRDTWDDLASSDGSSRWRLEFVTPATFHSGDRATPLPSLPVILAGLRRAWDRWSEPSAQITDVPRDVVWVSDLDLRSAPLTVQVRRQRADDSLTLHVCGILGTMDLRCDDPAAAGAVSALLRLAAYTGIGSMTRKGLGVTRVTALDGWSVRVRDEQPG